MIRVVEVVHATFYISHYAPMALGVYRDEGLDVSLVTSGWREAERWIQRGDADILVAAPMRTMQYFERTGERFVNFAEIIGRHAFFLIAKEPAPSFDWSELSGRRVINFAQAKNPLLCFRYLLRQQRIPESDVTIIDDLDSDQGVEAFRAGKAEYLLHPLDTAEALIAEGVGYLATPLAPGIGHIPFAAFAASPSYWAGHSEEIVAFTRAYARGLRWLAAHSAGEITDLVSPLLPGIPKERLTRSIERYQDLKLWPNDPRLSRQSFDHYREILTTTGWIEGRVTYEDLNDEGPVRAVMASRL